MSLLNTKTGFTTPWHCSVALMADGEWLSAPMGEFEKDPRMKIIYQDSRPSYFQETTDDMGNDQDSANRPVDVHNEENQELPHDSIGTSMPVTSSSLELDVEKMSAIEKTISACDFRDENGEPVNPFIGSGNPLLDSNSASFSLKTWLQAVMSITTGDSGRSPRAVAGVAYRNLSAHGVGEATDYQKTFGNYPLKLFNFAKRLLGIERQTRIQILRGFDGLVKSGEMLVVLGRPGRQVATKIARGL